MKKILFVSLVVSLLTSCDKEKLIKADDLPANSISYISTHFPSQQILQTVKDRDDLEITYKVYLEEGTRLEFNRKGEIIEMEGNRPLPDNTLPPLVLTYVESNYPEEKILGWEQEPTTQDVKLSGGVTLIFDRAGNFLRAGD